MPLHHTREMCDMRFAYGRDNVSEQTHPSDSDSERSYQDLNSGSDRSYSTQPTSYSSSPTKRAPQIHYDHYEDKNRNVARQFFDDRKLQESPRSSVDTYTSTVPSEEDLLEELPEYDVPEYTARPHDSSAIPATPSDFSELFPSRRKLHVRHDDSTLDGNMNLRVDTKVSIHDRECDMTLFHLRMHDLKNREFSLRRYCRDSGREVCHSVPRNQKPDSQKRPSFQRSLSNALSSVLPKSEHKTPTLDSLKRNDSGYGSLHSVDFNEDHRPRSAGRSTKAQEDPPSNSIKLDFSTYAHVEVRRNGTKSSKRYDFEYWGKHYSWKRIVRKDREFATVSYRMMEKGRDKVLAYIIPVPLTREKAWEEQQKGGWISPCSMWIEDENILRAQKDISDVVIATGLTALVDESIRARFHSKTEKQLLIPVSKLQMGVEYVGPKRLINEMFNRRDTDSNQHSRPSSSSRPSTSGVGVTGLRVTNGSIR